jgi:ankyrin repeat protein
MYLAIEHEDDAAVAKLIEQGGDPNERFEFNDLEGESYSSPIGEAVQMGNLRLVRILLKAGANPNVHNSLGATPLIDAARYPTADVLEELIKGGANVNDWQEWGDRGTALHFACKEPSEACVRALLAAKADPNIRYGLEPPPLFEAITTPHASLEVVSTMIEAGADVNPVIGMRGMTLVDFARDRHDTVGDAIVTLLQQHGAR